jgi:hypothetical protein
MSGDGGPTEPEDPPPEQGAGGQEVPPPVSGPPSATDEGSQVDEDKPTTKALPNTLSQVPEFSATTAEEHAAPRIETLRAASADTKLWDENEHTAKTQATLAFRLIWVLAGVLLGGAALLATTSWTGLASKDVTDFFGVAFGAVVTLTTAATSFWFGSQRGRLAERRVSQLERQQ